MTDSEATASLLGRTVFAAGGERLGPLVSLYDDSESGVTLFGGVAVGRLGRRRVVLVSLVDAAVAARSVVVCCGKDLARSGPSVPPGQLLAAEKEPELYAHYELAYEAPPDAAHRLAPH